MDAFMIEGTFRMTVRPLEASMPDCRAGEENLHPINARKPAARPNGAERRRRGRPSKAPEILALLPALRAFHGREARARDGGPGRRRPG
jgi:hypothetical protein